MTIGYPGSQPLTGLPRAQGVTTPAPAPAPPASLITPWWQARVLSDIASVTSAVGNITTAAARAQQQAQTATAQQRQQAREQARQAGMATSPTPGAPSRQSVYDAAAEAWANLGLDGREITNALRNAPPETWLSEKLMDAVVRGTQTWKDKFGATFSAVEQAGLPPMTEADIMSQREAYQWAMRGLLPDDFYDSNTDFDQFIANSISPDEVRSRAEQADAFRNSRDPALLNTLKDYYGVNAKEINGWFLDPDKALPRIERKVEAAKLGSETTPLEGKRFGPRWAEKMVGEDISRSEVRSAVNEVVQTGDAWRHLADIDNTKGPTDKQLVNTELGLNPKKKKVLASAARRERSRWAGAAGGETTFGKRPGRM